jgi:hypothetical protein
MGRNDNALQRIARYWDRQYCVCIYPARNIVFGADILKRHVGRTTEARQLSKSKRTKASFDHYLKARRVFRHIPARNGLRLGFVPKVPLSSSLG